MEIERAKAIAVCELAKDWKILYAAMRAAQRKRDSAVKLGSPPIHPAEMYDRGLRDFERWLSNSEKVVEDRFELDINEGSITAFICPYDLNIFGEQYLLPLSAGVRHGAYAVVGEKAYQVRVWTDEFNRWLEAADSDALLEGQSSVDVPERGRRRRWSATSEVAAAVILELYGEDASRKMAEDYVFKRQPVGPGISYLGRELQPKMDARLPLYARSTANAYEERAKAGLELIASRQDLE